jgi:hypothetical protein
MTTNEILSSAMTISYDPTTDELSADGAVVGGASELTREIMLARLAAPAEHADDSDETLFDLTVEAA